MSTSDLNYLYTIVCSDLLHLRILCEEMKETTTTHVDRFGNKRTVNRVGGRFASMRDLLSEVEKAVEVTSDAVQTAIKDSKFRERVGLITGSLINKTILDLAEKAKLDNKFVDQLEELEKEIESKIADQYGDDKDPFVQAIRKSKLPEPPKDASFKEKLEFQIARYQLLEDTLKNPEKYQIPKPKTKEPDKRKELLAKTAKAAIPVAISLAIAMGFEVAIPLILGHEFSLLTAFASASAGEAVAFGTDKALDKMDVKNPFVRIGAQVVAGLATGTVVHLGMGKINKTVPRLHPGQELEEPLVTADELIKTAEDSLEKHPVNRQAIEAIEPKLIKTPTIDIDTAIKNIQEKYPELNILKFDNNITSSFDVDNNKIHIFLLQQKKNIDGNIHDVYDISFTVNNLINKPQNMTDPKEGLRVANKIKQAFQKLLPELPNGTVLECIPSTGDNLGEKRMTIYKKFGFEGDDIYLYATVKDGKIVGGIVD